ncbi:MAG: hypothetical protein NW206_08745 [Hyphomonadaceae bacterium]|nr:hypothetical protein [Hyphomonadaceae bacterium]
MRGPTRRTLWLGAAASLAAGAGGCATSARHEADLRVIYNRSAQYHRPDRNPIVVIPGLLGSRLRAPDGGRVIWGAFDGGAANPSTDEGARALAAPLELDVAAGESPGLADADGVLERVRIRVGGIPFELAQYAQILATLGAGGYRDESLGLAGVDYGGEHFTCFQFAYDWRLDNAANATALKTFLDDKRHYVAQQYALRFGLVVAPASIRFDVVAHSMGALLLRYFMRYGAAALPDQGALPINWEGAGYFERAVLVAPPNAGSLLTLLYLVEGRDFGRPLLPFYPPAILGTYASLYQLLPRPRHAPVVWSGASDAPLENLFDPVIWRRYEWGLADRAQDRVRRALFPAISGEEDRLSVAYEVQARLLRRARRFTAALDLSAGPTPGVEAMLVAGDTIDTPRTLGLDDRTGRLSVEASGPGDGAVLRTSALLDERGDRWSPMVDSPLRFTTTLLLGGDHLGLTRSPSFSDNVLYWLLEEPRQRGAREAWL